MVHNLEDKTPEVKASAFIAWNAEVIGDVVLGHESSVWFSATLRGDLSPIRVGDRTNIQESAVLHVDTDTPLTVGKDVTIGHGAILHGCTVKDTCLIGMGAIILNNAEIGEGSVVGAAALVTEGKKIPPKSLVVGTPAKVVRSLTDQELAKIRQSAQHYVELARETQKQSKA